MPLLLVAAALSIYFDAWTGGIRKQPGRSSLVNLSPLGWAISVAGLALVSVPAYFLSRGKLRARTGSNASFAVAIGCSALLGLAFFVALFDAARAMEAQRAETARRRNPLFVPCAGQLVTELAAPGMSREFACPAGGRLSVRSTDHGVDLVFHPADPSGLSAAKLYGYVSSVFPNIGPPVISRASPCRGVTPLSVDPQAPYESRMAKALMAYKFAEGLAKSCDQMGVSNTYGTSYAVTNTSANNQTVKVDTKSEDTASISGGDSSFSKALGGFGVSGTASESDTCGSGPRSPSQEQTRHEP